MIQLPKVCLTYGIVQLIFVEKNTVKIKKYLNWSQQ